MKIPGENLSNILMVKLLKLLEKIFFQDKLKCYDYSFSCTCSDGCYLFPSIFCSQDDIGGPSDVSF